MSSRCSKLFILEENLDQLYKWLHAMVEFEHKISKTKIKQVKDK